MRLRTKWWHRVILSWPVLLVLFLFAGVLTKATYGIYIKNVGAEARASIAESELAEVQERTAQVEENLNYIKTSNGVEEKLRHTFDVGKEGEHLLVIIDKEIEYGTVKEPSSIWQSFKSAILGE